MEETAAENQAIREAREYIPYTGYAELVVDRGTYGERAVGLDFNPGGDGHVAGIKRAFAGIIDDMVDVRAAASRDGDSEKARLASVAITEAQTAQMWAVKAITWR